MIDIFKVVVFEKATGKILSIGNTCLPQKLETASQGVLLNVDADIEQDYVYRGSVVSKGTKPSAEYSFDYKNRRWVDMRTPGEILGAIRYKRAALLSATDWTQLPDVPLATKEAWAPYRQALRDITEQGDMVNVVWPIPPVT